MVRTAESVRFKGQLIETLPPGEIRRAVEGALERQRRFPLDTANALRGRLRREHFTIFKKGSKGISYVCAVKRRFRVPGQTFADSIGALISFIEANPMVRAGELPGKFLGLAPVAAPIPVEEALARMQEQNKHLSPAQARHLTEQGVIQNEDGTYSWKFDNYVRGWPPVDMTYREVEQLWERITCPTLLVYGKESWASNPAEDGRIRFFKTARVVSFERAGHWVQHDRLEAFLAEVRGFLAE